MVSPTRLWRPSQGRPPLLEISALQVEVDSVAIWILQSSRWLVFVVPSFCEWNLFHFAFTLPNRTGDSSHVHPFSSRLNPFHSISISDFHRFFHFYLRFKPGGARFERACTTEEPWAMNNGKLGTSPWDVYIPRTDHRFFKGSTRHRFRKSWEISIPRCSMGLHGAGIWIPTKLGHLCGFCVGINIPAPWSIRDWSKPSFSWSIACLSGEFTKCAKTTQKVTSFSIWFCIFL